MSKRKYNQGINHDLKDLSMLIMGLALLAVLMVIITVVYYAVMYWYLSIPGTIAIAYLYLYHGRVPKVPVPASRIIKTNEDIKINNGTKKTYTKEVYTDTKPVSLFSIFRS